MVPREDISYHTAEVLRQAENANVVEGGWVGAMFRIPIGIPQNSEF